MIDRLLHVIETARHAPERRASWRKAMTPRRLGRLKLAWLLAATLLLGACASSGSKRPVFYPNAHIQSVGQAQAQRDINACMALASEYGVATTKDGEIAKRTSKGAVLGGVGAGAWGLFRGDAGERAAAGAAAGAATGAATGAFESTELSPTFQRFVNRCLRERGYEVIGWE
jgi:hypothetical protein